MKAHVLYISNNQHDVIECTNNDEFIDYCEEHSEVQTSLMMLDSCMSLIPEIPQSYAVTEDIVVFSETAYDNEFIKQHELGHIACGHLNAALTGADPNAVIINDEWELQADAYAAEHTSKELALETLGSIRAQVLASEVLPEEAKDMTIKQLDLRIQHIKGLK